MTAMVRIRRGRFAVRNPIRVYRWSFSVITPGIPASAITAWSRLTLPASTVTLMTLLRYSGEETVSS